jgi:hypothetical protein
MNVSKIVVEWLYSTTIEVIFVIAKKRSMTSTSYTNKIKTFFEYHSPLVIKNFVDYSMFD